MEIYWLGHSSFLINNKEVTIVTDPFDSYIGYSMKRVKSNIVTLSHLHSDHNAVKNIEGDFFTLSFDNPFYKDDKNEIEIESICCFHDELKGKERGNNLIFIYHINGLKLCHMGDIGEKCSKDIIDKIGNIDILFIPIGGKYTIDASQAKAYCDSIKPKYIVPMHYKTSSCVFDIASIDEFLTLYVNEKVDVVKTNCLIPHKTNCKQTICIMEILN